MFTRLVSPFEKLLSAQLLCGLMVHVTQTLDGQQYFVGHFYACQSSMEVVKHVSLLINKFTVDSRVMNVIFTRTDT